jgi:hypothetical protein
MKKRFVGFIHHTYIGTFDGYVGSDAVRIMFICNVYAVYRGDITQQEGSKKYATLINVVDHLLSILPGVRHIHYVLVALM